MLTVAINSATQETSVALTGDGKLMVEKSWMSNRDEAEKILPGIASLLKKAGKTWKDVEEVFVVTGPGPFTGLRVGVTIANTLAMSVKCRIKTANIFQYLLTRVPKKLRSKSAILVKGGGDHFALVFEGMRKEKLLKFEKIAGVLKKSPVKYVLAEMKTGESLAMKKLLKSNGISVKFLTKKELLSFGTSAAESLKQTRKTSKLAQPLYFQKPHITESKKPNFTGEMGRRTAP